MPDRERQGDEMVKSTARILGPALLGLAFASTAFADGITLNGNLSSPTYISYTFTDQVSGKSVQEWVSPYSATSTINGVTLPSQFACLDINNGTQVGTYYSGTFGYAVTTADDEVSWLADQLAGTTPNNPLTYTGAISMAIWQLEFPSSTDSEGGTMPIDPAAKIWITDAVNAVDGGYKPDSVFFTPNSSTSQRFVEISLTKQPGTLGLLSPEPGSLVLMGTGFLGLVGLVRRKLRR
jgi:hypothetical protein